MKRMESASCARVLAVVAAVAATIGCSDEEPKFGLLESTPPNGADLSKEQQRLREMQLVVVEKPDGSDADELPDVEHVDSSTVAANVYVGCNHEASERVYGAYQSGCGSSSHDGCEPSICYAQSHLCAAQQLLDLVAIRSEPVVTSDGWTIYAQSNAANESLSRLAEFHAGTAMRFSAEALYDASVSGEVYSEWCTNAGAATVDEYDLPGGGSITEPRAVTLARSFAEALNLTREATDASVAATLAVSDAELNSGPRTKGIERAVANTKLSRAEAARILVGGSTALLDSEGEEVEHGFPGFVAGKQQFGALPEGGFCNQPELTSQAQAALSVLREAAPPPVAILNDDLDIDDLLNDTTTAVLDEDGLPAGSVLQRLSDYWASYLTTDPLPGQFNLEQEDFVQARRFMAQEILAFSRSMTKKEQRRRADGTLTDYRAYGATASSPEQPADVYYGALARYGVDNTNYSEGGLSIPYTGLPYTTTGFSNRIDYAISFAAALTANLDSGFYNGATRQAVKPLIGMMASLPDRPGRLRFCATAGLSVAYTDAWVQGYLPGDKLVIAKGEDALSCATKNRVEGMSCSLGDYGLKLVSGAATAVPGFSQAAHVQWSGLPTSDARYYLMKPKQGAPAPDENGIYPGGSYEALVGVTIPKNFQDIDSFFCVEAPIVPEAEQRAAAALAPNEDSCAHSRLNCAGGSFDERLPLEDELSDDNDDIESSWRRYLTLARQAADEADLLGEQYIQHGLEVDYREEDISIREEQKRQAVESIIDRLQETCGTSIDTTSLLSILSGESGDDLANFTLNECPCSDGYRCVMDVCVADLKDIAEDLGKEGDPDMLRLAECLDPDGSEPLVHMGDKGSSVCVWRGTGANANELCGLPSDCDPSSMNEEDCVAADHPCPALPKVNRNLISGAGACVALGLCSASEANCAAALGFGDYSPSQLSAIGVDIEPVQTGLGYFPLSSVPNMVPGKVCDSIRKNRDEPGSDIDGLQALIASDVLGRLRIVDSARRIGFEARFGGFAAVTQDGGSLFDTGSPWAGPSSQGFPCDDVSAFSGYAEGPGLFTASTLVDCADTAQRAAVNARMLRAVVAARFLTGEFVNFAGGSLGVVLPYEKGSFQPGSSGELRTLYDGMTVYSGKTSYGNVSRTSRGDHDDDLTDPANQWGIGTRTYYVTSGPTISPYFDENAGAADEIITDFIEIGIPETSGMSQDELSRALRGLSRDGSGEEGELLRLLRGDSAVSETLSSIVPGVLHIPPVLAGSSCSDEFGGAKYYRPSYTGSGSCGTVHPAHILDFSFEPDEMLDALELLCDVGTEGGCDLTPPRIEQVGDLASASRFLQCAADTIRGRSAMTVFANVPKRAVDALRQESVVGAYPALGGELGAAVSNIRTGLVGVARVAPLIANELEQLAADIKTIHGLLAQSSVRDRIADLQFMSQTADRLADCATLDLSTFGYNNFVRCANSIAQVRYASEINSLVREDSAISSELAMYDFSAKFSDRATNMQGYALELVTAIEGVDSGLVAFDGVQKKAERLVSQALYAASFHAKNEIEITSVLQQRKRTAQQRYQEAHRNAIRMAFLAKRAIELRLGVDLSTLTEKLPLVDAPSTWESTLCNTTSVNYQKLRENTERAPKDYAGAYIGDYVTKLENVVESYRLEFGFHEGEDVAVVSLRDDVMNVRAECDVPSENLLYQAGQLDRTVASNELEEFTWRVSGCRTDETGAARPDCITARPRSAAAFSSGFPGVDSALAYDIHFGVNGAYCSGTGGCGFQAGAELVQTTTLGAGRYRFSWYELPPVSVSPPWVVRDGSSVISAAEGETIPGSGGTWARRFVTFEIEEAKQVSVGFKQPTSALASIGIAAPMLEKVEDDRLDVVPGLFVNTADTLSNRFAACEDTGGAVFRATAWRRQCMLLCDDGFSSDCGGGAAKSRCYREAKFSINQRSLESGEIFKSAGFAAGNFNYRIDSIALNFVGTGSRDCVDSETPTSCYGAGFIPYSLEHLGPYYVRNHMGQDFKAELFTGRIEHARGLATERYLTNPLSSTDKELLKDYLRAELRGRPLDGNFVIRLWEEPGVDFDAIDDVQILLNYRYWTRFN